MKAKLTLEDGRTIDIELTPEYEKAMQVKKVGRLKPKEGDKYYYNDGMKIYGNICLDAQFDRGILETGEAYQTEEQAQFARDRKVFITKVNDRIDELNGRWVVYQGKNAEYGCIIYKEGNELLIDTNEEYRNFGTILSPIRNTVVAEQIISEFKDDLLKYIFN